MVPDCAGKANLLACHLCQGNLLEGNLLEGTDIKLGCMVAGGILQSHPLIHGILVAICENIHRERRGVMTLQGLLLNDTEGRLVTEAGVTLAMAGGIMFAPRCSRDEGISSSSRRLFESMEDQKQEVDIEP